MSLLPSAALRLPEIGDDFRDQALDLIERRKLLEDKLLDLAGDEATLWQAINASGLWSFRERAHAVIQARRDRDGDYN
jgi:hypothetical protein